MNKTSSEVVAVQLRYARSGASPVCPEGTADRQTTFQRNLAPEHKYEHYGLYQHPFYVLQGCPSVPSKERPPDQTVIGILGSVLRGRLKPKSKTARNGPMREE